MEDFNINSDLTVYSLKSKQEKMDRTLEDPILDSSKLNVIKVDSMLCDPMNNSDYIEESRFDLNVNHAISLNKFSHESEGNITIVPSIFSDTDRANHIIDEEKEHIEIVQTNFLPDNNALDEICLKFSSEPNSGYDSFSENVNSSYIKNESNIAQNNKNDIKRKDSQSNSVSSASQRKSKTRKSFVRSSIQVDKDDPRCRLHFVKFMKKEGKTLKIWECGICGKEFLHQYTLMRHLPTHTDERNFKCKHCNKAFRQMSTLAQHQATHTQSRPYVCDVCEKTFSRVSTLISHKKIHNDNKRHTCHTCGKAFHQKGNLKNHYYTHTNERPYKCDICGRGFNQSSNLHCHKLKSHCRKLSSTAVSSPDHFRCPDCGETFSRRLQLRRHQDTAHNLSTRRPEEESMSNIRIIEIPQQTTSPQNTADEGSLYPGLLINPIDTIAMHVALARGQTPFALFLPANGPPVIVNVKLCADNNHMLTPATAAELKTAGKFSVTSQNNGHRNVQIKVPVVASIYERVDEDGQVRVVVEPPEDDKEEEEEEDNEAQEKHFVIDDSTYVSEGDKIVNSNSETLLVSTSEDSATEVEASLVVSGDMAYLVPPQEPSVHMAAPAKHNVVLRSAHGSDEQFETHAQDETALLSQLKPVLEDGDAVTMSSVEIMLESNVLESGAFELVASDDSSAPSSTQVILNNMQLVRNGHVLQFCKLIDGVDVTEHGVSNDDETQ